MPVRASTPGTVGTVLDLVLPRPCPGCGRPGPWCTACASVLAGRPRPVALGDLALDALGDDKPRAGVEHGKAAGEHRRGLPVPDVWALARYSGPARAAIVAGKDGGRRDLPAELGLALGAGLLRLARIGVLPEPWWLVPAPSRQSAARRRGGDPVTAMARAAARRCAAEGVPTGVAPCLVTSHAARDSVGLTGAGRFANLAGRVAFRSAAAPPAGAPLIVLDDVVTSGATIVASCLALAAAGHPVSAALALAAVPPWRVAR